MAKTKTDINWKKLKAKCKSVEEQVKQLKKYNDALDENMCELYKHMQTVSSLSLYKTYVGNIDKNGVRLSINTIQKFNM